MVLLRTWARHAGGADRDGEKVLINIKDIRRWPQAAGPVAAEPCCEGGVGTRRARIWRLPTH